VNRQIGVGDSKYVVIFDPLPQGHGIQRMRSVTQCAIWPFTRGKCRSGLHWTFTSKYLGNHSS